MYNLDITPTLTKVSSAQNIEIREGKTFAKLPFKKIRKYGGKYVFTQTDTISLEKYEEYTSPMYEPETLIDLYFSTLIRNPETPLPLQVSLDVCKKMIFDTEIGR